MSNSLRKNWFLAAFLCVYLFSGRGYGDDSFSDFRGCIDCARKVYLSLLEVSESIIKDDYSKESLDDFLNSYGQDASCLEACLVESKLLYNPCSESYFRSDINIGNIEMYISSAVKFIAAIRDARSEENFFTGNKRSKNMAHKYQNYHYDNRFKRIEEAFGEVEKQIDELISCEGSVSYPMGQ